MPLDISGSFNARVALRPHCALLLLCAMAALMPLHTYAAVAFNSAANSGDISGQSSANWNHTVSGTTRYLVVGLAGFDGSCTLANAIVKYNGNMMTSLGTSGDSNQTMLWGLANPDLGTHAVSFSSACGGFNELAGGSVSFTGVRQSNSTGIVQFTTDPQHDDSDLNITLEAGDMGVDILYSNAAVEPLPGANETTRVDQSCCTSTWGMMGTEGGSGTVTMSWTDGGESDFGYSAVALKAGSGKTSLQKPANNLGLVGYWSFNEGTSTVATDFSGNGNHGTLSTAGSALPVWVNGKRGKALNFASDDTYVDMGAPSSLDMDGAMTVCAWANADALGADTSILSNSDGGPSNIQYSISVVSSGLITFFWANGGSYEQYDSATGLIVPGRWYHVCGVRNGSGVGTLYIDAQSIGTPTGDVSVPTSAGNATIGRLGSRDADYFDGMIDEVRIYSRALSAPEIAALAKTGAVKFNTSSVALQQGSTLANGLVGHWTFDGPDVTTTVTDRSGSANHGYFNGGATSSAKIIGKLGQALSFDGADDYVDAGSATSLDNVINDTGTSGTISFWMKPDAVQNVILAKNDANAVNVGWWLENISTTPTEGTIGLRLVIERTIVNMRAGVPSPPNGVWTHVVIVTDGSLTAANQKFYYNGVLQALTTSNDGSGTHGSDASETVFIARNRPTSGDGAYSTYDGILDDIRIYNRVLTAAEAKQLYKLGNVIISQ